MYRLTATFIDLSGLHAIYRAYRRQEQAGLALIVRSPAPRVLRLIELINLDDVLHFDA